MSRDHTLTERYLKRIGRPLTPVSDSELAHAFYNGAYAPRPLFLAEGETARLCRDLKVLQNATFRLPGLLFGGDLAAFARANGMDEVQVRVIVRGSAGERSALSSMGRADLYADRSGFQLMEFNLGGTIGFDSGDTCRTLLAEDAEFRRFAEEEGLQYVDTLTEVIRTLRHEMGLAPDQRPVVAHVEWPKYFEFNQSYMSALCKRFGEHGLEAHPCHVGQLERRDGRLWLGDRPVDIVYRQFVMENLLEDGTAALLEPLLQALENGEVRMFTSLESELYGSKASLAMLSNRANRSLFTEEELDVIDRMLPWTCSVTSEPVILPDGTEGSLLEHAIANQHELILKPTLLHSGQGVVPGWSTEITPAEWRDLLLGALDGPYVLQRRIHPVLELFPEQDGEARPWIAGYGVVLVASGYGGLFTRCAPAELGMEVLNLYRGAKVGSGFHVGPSAGT